jgi:hypothetical protein
MPAIVQADDQSGNRKPRFCQRNRCLSLKHLRAYPESSQELTVEKNCTAGGVAGPTSYSQYSARCSPDTWFRVCNRISR